MCEIVVRRKREVAVSFGKDGEHIIKVPVEEFDDSKAGYSNHKPGEAGEALRPWEETAGGISQSALDQVNRLRPTEEDADLDDWPNPDQE